MLTDVPSQSSFFRNYFVFSLLGGSPIRDLGENRRHSHPFVGNLKLGKMGSVPNDRYRVQIVVCCSSSFKNSNSLFDISKNLMRLLLKEPEAFMKSYLRIV